MNQYFNTAAFTTNAVGTYGNSGKNILTGPGTASLDGAIMKNWQFLERYRLQFRWEMFNALNHPSFALPATDPSSSSSFGRITETAQAASSNSSYVSSRVMQGGLKLTF